MLEKYINFKSYILYVVFGAYILLGYATLAGGADLAQFLYGEDQYFENIGAIGFFLAALFFLYGVFKVRGKNADSPFYYRVRLVLLMGLFLVFFFGAGEEISWGQRIFNVATPEALASVNAQGELNVHNIYIFEYAIRFEFLFDVLWGSLTLLLPLAVMFFAPVREIVGKFFAAPHIGVGLLFVFNYLWAKVATALFEASYKYDWIAFSQAVQEIKESNYAVFFALAALSIVQNILSETD